MKPLPSSRPEPAHRATGLPIPDDGTESVLQWRRWQLDVACVELARAREALAQARLQLADAERRLTALAGRTRQAWRSAPDPSRHAQGLAWLAAARCEQQRLQDRERACAADLESVHCRVMDRARAVQALERHQARRGAELLQVQLGQDMARADEAWLLRGQHRRASWP